jgi:hypothetical protein
MDWTCEICGKDTSNIEYDYLDGHNHLACVLGVWGGHNSLNKIKKMKIKGWEKISGYTYKGYSIVNPIHNADETKYEATILNLNLPQKPKWELTVLTSEHKFIIGDSAKVNAFLVILKDDEGRSTINTIHKDRMKSISIFRNTFEEMIDKLLGMRLTSATQTINANSANSGILNVVQNSGTKLVFGQPGNIHIDLIDTLKDLQKQIDELKQNTPSNPF